MATQPAMLMLEAGAARILGEFPLPNYDAAKGFIGSWTQRKAQLQWKTQLPVPGRYQVWIELACPEASAGSAFEVSAADQSLKGIVPSTGGWEQFKPHFLGVLDLNHARVGDLTITLSPTTQPGDAVMNFPRCTSSPRSLHDFVASLLG